jgi:nitrogen regulatory protein P-II 1
MAGLAILIQKRITQLTQKKAKHNKTYFNLNLEDMNEIKAFIRPERLSEVTLKLREENFCCFTVFQGEGVGD